MCYTESNFSNPPRIAHVRNKKLEEKPLLKKMSETGGLRTENLKGKGKEILTLSDSIITPVGT